ncbi:MAG: methyltransferase domain-containing protein [Phycisphaerales bacterium]|nr:methyltransferase domain-containing protein [Phycisphaerales bacterium]
MLPFIRQAIADFKHTGSIWPSSRQLAAAMTRSLRQERDARRILEVGPGTGPFTRVILDNLRPGDEFHLVEINPAFCRNLEQNLLGPFREANPDIHVELHESAIEQAPLEPEFHHVVCGLPFNNFPPIVVRSIFRQMMGLLAEGGDLSYFEYAGVRIFKRTLPGKSRRNKIRQHDLHGKSLRRQHEGSRKLVMANFPPAFAVRLVRVSPA